MSLSNYRVLQEAKEYFKVHDGKSEFRVAKKGLNPTTLAKIQGFQAGGEVPSELGRGYEEEGSSDKSDKSDKTSLTGLLSRRPRWPGVSALPEFLKTYVLPPGLSAMAGAPQQLESPTDIGGGKDVTETEREMGPEVPPGSLATPVGTEVPGAFKEPKLAVAKTGGGGGIESEIKRTAEAEETAIRQKGAIGEHAALAQKAVQDELNQQRETEIGKWREEWESHKKVTDAAFEAYKNATVDPNRLWHQASTGGKISAAIGMILGGMGAGMTRGPNYAMQVMQNALNRDLEAQKLDLGKKGSILSHYMQQGHEMVAAHQLAMADLKDMAAGKALSAAYQYGSQEQIQQAEILANQAHMDSIKLRQAVSVQQLDKRLKGLEIQRAEMGLQLEMAALGEFYNKMGGAGQPGGAGMGANIDPRIFSLPGMEKYGERAVQLPDGTYALAPDKTQAEKAREGFKQTGQFKSKLLRYTQLMNSDPRGIWNPFSEKWGEAEGIRDSMVTDLNHLSDIKRLNDREVKLFLSRITNLHGWVGPGGRAKIRELGREVDEAVLGTLKSELNLRPGKRPGP